MSVLEAINNVGSVAAPVSSATPSYPQVNGAAAQYLGLSPQQLRAQTLQGESLADIATAQGKSVSGLKKAMMVSLPTGQQAQGASYIDKSIHNTHPHRVAAPHDPAKKVQAGHPLPAGGIAAGVKAIPPDPVLNPSASEVESVAIDAYL